MRFERLRAETLENWIDSTSVAMRHKRRLVIAVSGYEERSSYWSKRVMRDLKPSDTTQWLVAGFTDRKEDGSRPENDRFYLDAGLNILEFPSDEESGICETVSVTLAGMLRRAPRSDIEVHIDYSSMPRSWYCSLFRKCHTLLRQRDTLFMWYVGGIYDGAEFPTAGVSDISLFCGQPTINPRVRTHIFGLGFDRIRASAIFRVLDPQKLVCFYGDPGVRHDYVDRVRSDNRDLLAAAQFDFAASIGNFPEAFSKIADVVRDFSRLGDVILVPDGPKPLVLASSLAPEFFGRRGIVSLHVKRRKDHLSHGQNIQASGSIYGFSIAGVESNQDAEIQLVASSHPSRSSFEQSATEDRHTV